MPTALKVAFALLVALLSVFGFLSIPYLDTILETCTGSWLCGKSIKEGLDYLARTDKTALAFGEFLYDKILNGVIVFLAVLIFSIIAHRVYTHFKD
jgi:hypothetical protein